MSNINVEKKDYVTHFQLKKKITTYSSPQQKTTVHSSNRVIYLMSNI